MTEPTRTDLELLNQRAEARKWESRARANIGKVRRLEDAVTEAEERAEVWRVAYNNLRATLGDRLNRIIDLLEEDDTPTSTTTTN